MEEQGQSVAVRGDIWPIDFRANVAAVLNCSYVALSGNRGNGLCVLISREDYPIVGGYRWYLGKNGYVARNVSKFESSKSRQYLHHLIVPPQHGLETEHKNRLRLDCRRSNLRLAKRWQNNANHSVHRHNSIGLKGVRKNGNRKFSARIRKDGAEIYLGSFDTAEEAARAYDLAAVSLFGEYSRTNKMEGLVS